MRSTFDVVFVYLPASETDRVLPDTIECMVTAFEKRARCRLVIEAPMRGGERQQTKLHLDEPPPAWMRKGLTLRLWLGSSTFGAAIVQETFVEVKSRG